MGYILYFGFLRFVLFVSKKKKNAGNFYVFKFIIISKYLTLLWHLAGYRLFSKGMSGVLCFNLFQLQNYITVHVSFIQKLEIYKCL